MQRCLWHIVKLSWIEASMVQNVEKSSPNSRARQKQTKTIVEVKKIVWAIRDVAKGLALAIRFLPIFGHEKICREIRTKISQFPPETAYSISAAKELLGSNRDDPNLPQSFRLRFTRKITFVKKKIAYFVVFA